MKKKKTKPHFIIQTQNWKNEQNDSSVMFLILENEGGSLWTEQLTPFF